MVLGFRVWLEAISDVRLRGFQYIWANLAFVVCSLPLLTLPAAFAALMHTVYRIQTSPQGAEMSDFLDTFRAQLWRALPWGLAYAGFFALNAANLWSYGAAQGPVAGTLRALWLSGGFVALNLLLYTWPFYFEMAQPSLLGATRNALVLLLHNPGFSLSLLIGCLLIIGLSSLLSALWVLLSFAALASVANSAVQNRLAARAA